MSFNTTIKPNVSRYEKEKNNFERQIALADYFDQFYGTYRDDSRLDKFLINYDLANGRLDTSLYDVEDDYCMIEGEKVTIHKGEIPHIPMTAQVIKALQGEQLARPWKLSVDDESPLKDSIQTDEWKKQLKAYMQVNTIAPLEEQAYARIMSEIGQVDPSLMTPEQVQQLQSEIGSKVQEEVAFQTADEMIEWMQNDYQNPIAKQAQEVINHLDKKFDIKTLEVEGFSHMLPTGEEYFYVNIGDHGLEFDIVPPDSFSCGGPSEEVWSQKMDWAKIEKFTSIIDIKNKYAESLKSSHIAELDKMYEPRHGTKHYSDHNPGLKRYMYEFSADPEGFQEKFGNQDWKKKENFNNIALAYASIQKKWGLNANFSDFSIREAKIFWKDHRIMYRVLRLADDNTITTHYFDEHYVSTEEDLEVKRIITPEVWECTILGTEDPIYLNIRPVKGQYKSNKDPYDVELPVIGRAFNTFRNRTKNVTMVDMMKQFQRDYDTEMAALRKDLASNIGKVFVMMMHHKPKNMTWSSMISIAKDHNLMLIDPTQKGAAGIDPQFMREVNMSKMSEIAERVNLLREILGNLYAVAGFNQFRAGQGGQYANTENIQTQQQSSYNQTEGMFETHRKIVEKACTRLMNIARIYYKDHPEELRNILSPSSYMELESGYPFWYSYFNVRLDNSGKVARQVEYLKQYTQAFIQNGMEPKDVIGLALAESKSDLMDILNKIDVRQKEAIKQAQEAQMQQFQMQTQLAAESKAQDQAHEKELEVIKGQFADQRSERDYRKFQLAADVDEDGTADLLESKQAELAQRDKEHEDKMELARQKQIQTTVSARI